MFSCISMFRIGIPPSSSSFVFFPYNEGDLVCFLVSFHAMRRGSYSSCSLFFPCHEFEHPHSETFAMLLFVFYISFSFYWRQFLHLSILNSRSMITIRQNSGAAEHSEDHSVVSCSMQWGGFTNPPLLLSFSFDGVSPLVSSRRLFSRWGLRSSRSVFFFQWGGFLEGWTGLSVICSLRSDDRQNNSLGQMERGGSCTTREKESYTKHKLLQALGTTS